MRGTEGAVASKIKVIQGETFIWYFMLLIIMVFIGR